MNDLREVTIYTDGGADPNPGPGGWGAVLVHGMSTKDISGAEPATTNNRMELTAAIMSLRMLGPRCRVRVVTDSQYLRRGITEWVAGWERQGWRKRNGAPVENVDLWQALLKEVGRHEVEWAWVRGHRGNPLNERADALASAALRAIAGRKSQAGRSAAAPQDLLRVAIYARGCALGVPGPAGYAATIVREGQDPQVASGGWPLASSNVMELQAVIAGLRTLRDLAAVELHTTSAYVFEGATRWLAGWEHRGWTTADGRPVKNREVWEELTRLLGDHDVRWHQDSASGAPEESRMAAEAARAEAERQRDKAPAT